MNFNTVNAISGCTYVSFLVSFESYRLKRESAYKELLVWNGNLGLNQLKSLLSIVNKQLSVSLGTAVHIHDKQQLFSNNTMQEKILKNKTYFNKMNSY